MSSSGLKKLVPAPVKSLMRSLLNRMPVSVEVRPLRRDSNFKINRFTYQQRYVKFDIKPGERVLDIGSGGDPFPYATHLVDRYLDPTEHRNAPLIVEGKPLISADIERLPFYDKSFDFIYCSHVLEHVEDPLRTCAELMRVGKRGFIETPTMGKDMLFAWTEHTHKWHVVACAQSLCFFEYSPREVEGVKSLAWRDVIFSKYYHPLQDAFYENQDIFNVLFNWVDSFTVFVFRKEGTIESLNAELSETTNASTFRLAHENAAH